MYEHRKSIITANPHLDLHGAQRHASASRSPGCSSRRSNAGKRSRASRCRESTCGKSKDKSYWKPLWFGIKLRQPIPQVHIYKKGGAWRTHSKDPEEATGHESVTCACRTSWKPPYFPHIPARDRVRSGAQNTMEFWLWSDKLTLGSPCKMKIFAWMAPWWFHTDVLMQALLGLQPILFTPKTTWFALCVCILELNRDVAPWFCALISHSGLVTPWFCTLGPLPGLLVVWSAPWSNTLFQHPGLHTGVVYTLVCALLCTLVWFVAWFTPWFAPWLAPWFTPWFSLHPGSHSGLHLGLVYTLVLHPGLHTYLVYTLVCTLAWFAP